MGKLRHGTISEINRNYGIIKSKYQGREVAFFFYLFPSMLNKKEQFIFTKQVLFDVRTVEIRGSKVMLAYNLKQVEGSERKKYNIPKHKRSQDILTKYHHYIFSNFLKITDEKKLKDLIKIDTEFKEFCLNRVLFLEQSVKHVIIESCLELNISDTEVYNLFEHEPETLKIKTKCFKKLKSKFEFREEFKLFSIRQSIKDVNTCEVIEAPLGIFLDNITIDELSKVLNCLYIIFNKNSKKPNNKIKFLKYIRQLLPDLSIIRNASAHGNPLIPLILDIYYSPNFSVDLRDVFPSFNSGNNVEDIEIFGFIRWTTRQLAKRRIIGQYAGGLQFTALYYTKYVFSNPARRSFFSLFHITFCYFEFIDDNNYKKFIDDANNFIGMLDKDLEYPYILLEESTYQKISITQHFFNILYPIVYTFSGGDYGMFLDITAEVDKP
ncbi:hypothetical protein LKF67_2522 [Lactococcus lactis subsp. lactis]|uniref:Abi family protein n=1 Tax=Lactococcus lactis TaxID=1358 RepID=UPI00071D5F55|nr:Abi family protein [Lactococcus lactis]KST88008.1 hypothetical protein LKF67_2522 [Lactococcus lactis subsp. lactis]